jgi:hypothetical protein
MCLQLPVEVVENKPLNKASVTTTRGSTIRQQTPMKASVTKTTGSSSGQQTPL